MWYTLFSRSQEKVYGMLHGTLTPVNPSQLLPSNFTNDGQSGPSGVFLSDESTLQFSLIGSTCIFVYMEIIVMNGAHLSKINLKAHKKNMVPNNNN